LPELVKPLATTGGDRLHQYVIATCAADDEAVEVAGAHDLFDQVGVLIGERYVFDSDAGPLEQPRGGTNILSA
jgi:hypothetical protein